MDLQNRYDTDDVPHAERFAYWRDAVCDSYVRLACETDSRRGFKGSIEISRHSVLSVSEVAGQSHRVIRRKRDIRASNEAYFLLSLQTANTCALSQSGKDALLRPGDMALYASSDPYRLALTDGFRQTVVQLPHAKLIERLPNAPLLTAQRIDGQSGIGKLVRENILAFSTHMSSAPPTLHALLQDTVIDLIATGLATQSAAQLELSSPDQQVLLRAKSYIRDHLGEADLDRARVAAATGMSVRRLNEIFGKEGETISAHIRRSRLERMAEALRDPRYDACSISELAFRNGFSNMQNVSTLFRATFGASPRAYRKERGQLRSSRS